jgi:hypothetical protein
MKSVSSGLERSFCKCIFLQELRELPGEVPSLLKTLQTSLGLVSSEPRVDLVEKKPAQTTAGALVDGALVSLANNNTADMPGLGRMNCYLNFPANNFSRAPNILVCHQQLCNVYSLCLNVGS